MAGRITDNYRRNSSLNIIIMNNRTLGLLALAGAPLFLLSMYVQPYFSTLHPQQFYGIWTTLYITAWICSVLGLQRLRATGFTRFGKGLVWVQLASLVLADLSNLYQLVWPGSRSLPFIILDSFWPISNLLMLVMGIAIFRAKVLQGWTRWVPLFVGCWLPVMVICGIFYGRTGVTGTVAGVYSAVAWSLLAVVIIRTGKGEKLHSYSAGHYRLV
jgi:hypothetical protein